MNQAPQPQRLTPEQLDRRSNRRALTAVGVVLAAGTIAAVAAFHGGGEHADDTISPGFGEPTPTASAPLVPESSPTPSETVSATPSVSPTPEATPAVDPSDEPTAEDQNRDLRRSVANRYDSCDIQGFTQSGPGKLALDMTFERNAQSMGDRNSHDKTSPGLSWTSPTIAATIVNPKGGLTKKHLNVSVPNRGDVDARNAVISIPSHPKNGTEVTIFAKTTASSPLEDGDKQARTTDEVLCGTLEYTKKQDHWDLSTAIPDGVHETYTHDTPIS